MTGSMYAAVSGLKSHMNALNVIGNNVSNVNTTAYKSTRYTFNEALYTTQRSGSDGTQVSGGRNPAQIGFGASIGTIDLDMSTKNYTPTGQLLDTMIDGDGFFFVSDKELGNGATAVPITETTTLKGMNLTRLGNFNIDPNGYLVDGNGSVVWGFLEEQVNEPPLNEDKTDYAGAFARLTDAGQPNYVAEVGGEGDATATIKDGYYEFKTNGEVTARYRVFKVTENSKQVYKTIYQLTEEDVEQLKRDGENIHNVEYKEPPTEVKVSEEEGAATKKVSFVKTATVTNNRVMGAIRLPTKDADKTIKWPTYVAEQPAERDEDGNLTKAAEPAKFNDGAVDRLQADSVTIDEKSGALRAMTSDGKLYTIGYLAIGKVTNPNGVTHVDGRYYQAQDGAGEVRVTSIMGAVSGPKDALGNYDGPESSGDTALITGGLESSGTDLATEITNMITVQRGYQANTRIVTVTDSMLEELVNMKR